MTKPKCPRCGGEVIEFKDGTVCCAECGWRGEE